MHLRSWHLHYGAHEGNALQWRTLGYFGYC
jgi:hypothetical protein